MNDAASMFCIGVAYELGKGTTIDYARRRSLWYTKGGPGSMVRLLNQLGALSCKRGRGTKQDATAAFGWRYKKAADLNYAAGDVELGGVVR